MPGGQPKPALGAQGWGGGRRGGWRQAQPLFPTHQSRALGHRQVAVEAKLLSPPDPLKRSPTKPSKKHSFPEDPWAKLPLHLQLDVRLCGAYRKAS